ncbi:MAG TPA: hypothetical protein VN203_18205 [Candidatus Acidoferrum sp.]|nr:hypothetical protein [Candidatus Acidoferrum sp.]
MLDHPLTLSRTLEVNEVSVCECPALVKVANTTPCQAPAREPLDAFTPVIAP